MQLIELLFDRVRDTAWDIFVNIVKEDEFPMSPKLNFRNCVICFLYQEKISTWKCNENYVTWHLLKKQLTDLCAALHRKIIYYYHTCMRYGTYT